MSETSDPASSPVDPKIAADRQLLIDAETRGIGARVGAMTRLSGPGWLQSAITLGGGSLTGALFLGVLGGYSMLWVQLVAIILGVIMLSAISYVTLTTGKKPFQAINQHINPALGWSWALATCTANILWCMPQFSLAYAALDKNLLGDVLNQDTGVGGKLMVSAVILALTLGIVYLNSRGGKSAKAFDWFLKGLVGIIVISFFGVVIVLATQVGLPWGEIFGGFVPDLGQASEPTGAVATLVGQVTTEHQSFWSDKIVSQQRAVMIAAAATAVGINMTFLLPYSMLNRGWDRHFRGLARFDLATGMAIPYVLVTTCVVIAAASQFHAQADDKLLSSDPAVMVESPLFAKAKANLVSRAAREYAPTGADAPVFADLPEPTQLARVAALSQADKRLAASLIKRDAFALSASLAPLLGTGVANQVFGLGVLGMAISTIIILMLINGYVMCEMFRLPQGGRMHMIGCLIAGVAGAIWPLVWDGPAKFWLAILVSAFGMMLLPIAYITFFCMLNSKSLMGDARPQGGRRLTWNILMGVAVIGSIAAAATAVIDKASDPKAGWIVITLGSIVVIAVLIGFMRRRPASA
ncbi:MAG: divalent metal cation transporter [Planctomycetota bacterium]|nr:divalent metal cation transporter [Planctomycetota bacterium]